jgi:hypothetical protein
MDLQTAIKPILASFLIAAGLYFYSLPTVIDVPPGGDLQAAINTAQPGDTIVLQADADYTCTCVLPNKAGSEYITIKSSRYEEIPTREFYSKVPTAEVAKLMPRIKSNYSTEPIFAAAPASHHYKLLGLNLQPPAGQGTRIVELGVSGPSQDTLGEMPHHFLIDKSWLHAGVEQEMQRCLALNSSDTDITNSWLTECHGRGYDTQAIAGWNGAGNYRIINNSLSGAAENFILGGSPATIANLVPTNVEFRRNYVWKPLSWYVNDPSYAGVRWSVKNLFELKNSRNVVVEGNVFDGNWTDAQAGRAIQLTPRPNDSGVWAVVEDVQLVNNIIRNTAAGINVLGRDESPAPNETRLRRVRIANNIWEIDGPRFGSDGAFLVITNGTENVTVENNTVIHTGNIISSDYAPNAGFIYRNNISRHNTYGVFGGGRSTGTPSLEFYFPGYQFTGNVIAKEILGPDAPQNPEPLYPAGNFFPASLDAIGFVDWRNGNYRLQTTSPYLGKGCDIEALNAAMGGMTTPIPTPSSTPSPSPSIAPSPVPTPTPVPSPTATPTPIPSPTPPPVCSMTVSVPTIPQWGSGKLVVNLSGLNVPGTLTAAQTSGQVTVDWPTSRTITGTSVIAEFGLQAKKKSSAVTISGPCGSQTVMVNVR